MARNMKKYSVIGALGVVVLFMLILGGYMLFDYVFPRFFEPTYTTLEQGVTNPAEQDIAVVASNLTVPWGLTFLPNGDMLVTERPGTLKRIDEDTETVTTVDGVKHRGEGGLLGIALHPQFSDNRYLYLYMTTEVEGGLRNRVMRYTYQNTTLQNPTPIMEDIPGAQFHDGGRIAFGPDEKLYITVGDALNTAAAQDPQKLNGSILRLNPDGSVPEGNPFDNPVYSYGHRNPQGLAWTDNGQLWATEHGNDAQDEVNVIEKGANYGWPVIRGNETHEDMRSPVRHSGADETWAPGGATFVNGDLFFVGLRGQSMYEADVKDKEISQITAHLRTAYGRLRSIVQGPEGGLYVTTSNRDGRGRPTETDDRIIRINSQVFEE